MTFTDSLVTGGDLEGLGFTEADVINILFPAYVTSKSDGDLHYVGVTSLMKLYGVGLGACLCVSKNEAELSLQDIAWKYGLYDLPVRALAPRFRGDYDLSKVPCYVFGKPKKALPNPVDSLRSYLSALDERVPHPGPQCVEGKDSEVWYMVVHLNDYHEWSREQIADWLDTLDIDLTFKVTV